MAPASMHMATTLNCHMDKVGGTQNVVLWQAVAQQQHLGTYKKCQYLDPTWTKVCGGNTKHAVFH
jgi:hypothetical protein